MKMIPLLVMGMVVLNSCEGDLDNLGSQLVDVNASEGVDKAFSLITYNIDNNDLIRADATKLDSVRIGAFTEDVFGGQKASYITQVRLNTYNPDFGTNPAIDSVVLTLKPRYESAADSLTTTTNEDYIYPDGEVAAKKVVTTYPVSKYGKYKIGGQKTKFTIKVNDVNDFLGSTSDSLASNKTIALGAELGSKAFDGTVNSVVVTKDSDATELLNRAVSYRMELTNKDFFKTKLFDKKGDQVLKDAASFIRYFKGISISVQEEDGYLFSMAPNDAAITIYYKNDVTATDGTVTRTKAELALNLGSGNVHLSNIAYNRTNEQYLAAMTNAIKIADFNKIEEGKSLVVATNNYAQKLYLQGMGGSSVGIRIPAETITTLKNMYKNEKIGIVSAKIRLYNDDSWDNKYKKPSNMLVKDRVLKGFLPDMTSLANAGYSLLKTGNLSTKDAYYDIGITASLKTIIENEAYDPNTTNRDYIINLGSYLSDASTGLLLGQGSNTRTYNPYRIVLNGTVDTQNVGQEISDKKSKEAQLRLIFTKK